VSAETNFRRLYTNYVLRPITVIAAVYGIYSLFHRSWLSAGIFLAAWFFISVIGHDLVKPSALDRLKNGRDETYLVAQAAGKTTLVLFVLISITMVGSGIRWYFAVPAAWLLGFCVAAIPMAVIAYLVGFLQRRKLS
jgi:hypothetical protein